MDTRVQKIIEGSKNIVFFGGAGVSTESGIPDFRSEKGLYRAVQEYGYPPEQMLSHSFFMRHTALFFDYYRKHMIYEKAEPNAAHRTLARLEREGKMKAVVTQNIDGLHQKAGSRVVYELHGSVMRNLCMDCGAGYGLEVILASEEAVPRCGRCGGVIKPDVVLYEEALDEEVIGAAVRAIRQADTLIVGGTSLAVYPAAGLIRYFGGKELILINRDATPYDSDATLVVRDSIGKVLAGEEEAERKEAEAGGPAMQ